jgi:hypothetical protein
VSHPTDPRASGPAVRRYLLAMGAGLVAVGLLAAPASASPSPWPPDPIAEAKPAIQAGHQPGGPVPAGFGSWADVFAMQERLNAAATRILAAGGAGNASIVAAPENRELRVYWNGRVPGAVRTLATQLGVPVSFRPAAFTHRELVAAARQLAGSDSRIAEVAPKADGSGLEVTVTSTAPGVGTVDPLATSRIPLTIKTGQRPQAAFSRQADTPPFWGGSRYSSPAGGCSNGFALNFPGAAHVFELTTGHCGENNQTATIPRCGAGTH